MEISGKFTNSLVHASAESISTQMRWSVHGIDFLPLRFTIAAWLRVHPLFLKYRENRT